MLILERSVMSLAAKYQQSGNSKSCKSSDKHVVNLGQYTNSKLVAEPYTEYQITHKILHPC